MIVIFNLALFALVLLSFVMIVGVPVAYAAPQNWDRSKQLLFVGSGLKLPRSLNCRSCWLAAK
jgi:photosystem II PsbZ protein